MSQPYRALELTEGLAAGARRTLATDVRGPCQVLVGVWDAWGVARMRLAPVRGQLARIEPMLERRVGPAGWVPFNVPPGASASFDLAVDGVNSGALFEPLTGNGYGDGDTGKGGTVRPRAFVRMLPEGTDLEQRYQGQILAPLAGADGPNLPFGAPQRDGYFFPRAAARQFVVSANVGGAWPAAGINVDLVGADGVLLFRFAGASATPVQGSVGPWQGIKVRNLEAATDIAVSVQWAESPQRWI